MLNSRNNHNFTYLEELSFLKYTKHVTVFFFTIFLFRMSSTLFATSLTSKMKEKKVATIWKIAYKVFKLFLVNQP